MKDWELAQLEVAKAVGGKVTPGSGNGKQKGDVQTDSIIIEVKHTSRTTLTIQRRWLTKLIREWRNDKSKLYAVLVVFFQLRGYVYMLDVCAGVSENYDWKALAATEANLPEELPAGPHHVFKLITWETLRNL